MMHVGVMRFRITTACACIVSIRSLRAAATLIQKGDHDANSNCLSINPSYNLAVQRDGGDVGVVFDNSWDRGW